MKTICMKVERISIVFERRLRLRKAAPFIALKDISFEIYQSEVLGIIGRNGAGKSSLLRALANVLIPDQGRIINYGYSVALLSLAVGFDQRLNALDNIMLSGLLLGLPKEQIERDLEAIIEFAELGDFIDQPLYTYSSGMRLRLGFSIALYLKPGILLIDEVLGVGDARFRQKSRRAMCDKILSEQTVVLVSHDIPLMRELCDRIIWIENGLIQQQGDPNEVLSAYAQFVLETES